MPISTSFKNALAGTTALIGAAVLVPSIARAANVTVTTAVVSTQLMNNTGDTLTVTSSGSINAAPAVNVTAAADFVNNSGIVNSTGRGINLPVATSALTGGITNNAGGTISGSSTAVYVDGGANVASVDNSGHIGSTNGFDIQVVNAGSVSGVTNETGGTMHAAVDGIRAIFGGTIGAISNLTGATISASQNAIRAVNTSHLSGGITNHGLIHGGFAAITDEAGSTITGDIDNFGAVTAGNVAVQIAGGSVLTGDFKNETGATVSGANEGLVVSGAGSAIQGQLSNSGFIAGGNNGVNVNLTGSIQGGLVNDGTISGSNGVNMFSGGTIGGITNNGFINGAGADGIVTAGGGDVTGTGVDNEGTISATFGGIVSFGGDFSQGVVNNGTINALLGIGGYGGNITGLISNAASGVINGATGVFSLFSNDLSAGVTNNGTISAGSEGVVSYSNSDISGGVINNGKIHGGYDGVVSWLNSDISGGVTNNAGGTISGSSDAIGVFTAAITGGIHNSGLIQGLNGTAITLDALTGSTPIDIQGGRIVGDVIDDTPSAGFSPVTVNADFTTEGNFDVSSVTVASGKTLTVSPGDTVRMNTMPASAGTLDFGVTSASNFGSIVVTNGAVDLSAATVTVNVTGMGLVNGDKMLIADGTQPINGGPLGVLTPVVDNSALWDFQIADGTVGGTDDTDLFLFATLVTAPSPGNADVFNVIEGLSGSADPGVQNALANINGAGSQGALDNALNSLQPETDTGVVDTVNSFVDVVLGTLDKHLELVGATGVSSGDAPQGRGFWGQVFGQALNADARGGVPGYGAHTAGFALGAETTKLGDDTVAGFSFGYGRSSVDSDNVNNTQSDIDSYGVNLYAHRNFASHTYLRGVAGYSWNGVDTTRYNVGGAGGPTARGSFTAHQYGARLETGRGYGYGAATLIPNLTFNWTHYDPQSYTEAGAGALDLNVNGKAVDKAELGAGLKVKWGWKDKQGDRFTPVLRFGYRYDLAHDRLETASTFTGGGAAFTSQGAAPARGSANIGGSLIYETASDVELQAIYDLDMRAGYVAHAGAVRATYRF